MTAINTLWVFSKSGLIVNKDTPKGIISTFETASEANINFCFHYYISVAYTEEDLSNSTKKQAKVQKTNI